MLVRIGARAGEPDVFSANFEDDAVVWYGQARDYSRPNARTWSVGAVVSNVEGATSVFCADVDGDGTTDVVSASLSTGGEDAVAWHDLHLVPYTRRPRPHLSRRFD